MRAGVGPKRRVRRVSGDPAQAGNAFLKSSGGGGPEAPEPPARPLPRRAAISVFAVGEGAGGAGAVEQGEQCRGLAGSTAGEALRGRFKVRGHYLTHTFLLPIPKP